MKNTLQSKVINIGIFQQAVMISDAVILMDWLKVPAFQGDMPQKLGK